METIYSESGRELSPEDVQAYFNSGKEYWVGKREKDIRVPTASEQITADVDFAERRARALLPKPVEGKPCTWSCLSWDDDTIRYVQTHCISGAEIETTCTCRAGSKGKDCKHQFALRRIVYRERRVGYANGADITAIERQFGKILRTS